MKTLRVQYDEPARSKSRNVNRAVRAEVKRRALWRAYEAALLEYKLAGAALTGGQLAEARRLLAEVTAVAS